MALGAKMYVFEVRLWSGSGPTGRWLDLCESRLVYRLVAY